MKKILPLSLLSLVFLSFLSLEIGNLGFLQGFNEVFSLSRLPRTLAVILTGAGLSVAGLVMQIIVHNNFVEPNTTGTSEGASIGLLITAFYFPAAPLFLKIGFASLTALISMLFFIQIARKLPLTEPLLLPLVGLIYAGVLNSLMQFVAYQSDLMQWLQVWLNGDFSAILKGRYEWLWGCGLVILALYFLADRISIVGMGKSVATSLGLNYKQMVLLSLVFIAILTAFVISTVGSIAFLGLLVPNIVRIFSGDNLRLALPYSVLFGANLLLFCDILARTLNAPYEIPVSLIYGLIGTVIFLYLLLRAKNDG